MRSGTPASGGGAVRVRPIGERTPRAVNRYQ
jgi:hypothetical protein